MSTPSTTLASIHAELGRLAMAVQLGTGTFAELGTFVGLHIDEIREALRVAERRTPRRQRP